jgi:hypothetical protein
MTISLSERIWISQEKLNTPPSTATLYGYFPGEAVPTLYVEDSLPAERVIVPLIASVKGLFVPVKVMAACVTAPVPVFPATHTTVSCGSTITGVSSPTVEITTVCLVDILSAPCVNWQAETIQLACALHKLTVRLSTIKAGRLLEVFWQLEPSLPNEGFVIELVARDGIEPPTPDYEIFIRNTLYGGFRLSTL